MKSSEQVIRRELELARRELQDVVDALHKLNGDLYLVQEAGVTIYYCIDVSDLLTYLSIKPPDARSAELLYENALKDYVALLLFTRLEPAPILLPEYYEEFRGYVVKELGDASLVHKSRLEWINAIYSRLGPDHWTGEHLLSYLRSTKDQGAEYDVDKVRTLAVELLRSLREFGERVTKNMTMGRLLQRFHVLQQRGRLRGLHSAIGTNRPPALEDTAQEAMSLARQYLGDHRPGKDRQNDTDASAIASIIQLNQLYSSQDKFFHLLSTARTMALVADEINRKVVRISDEPVEVRGSAYWQLWFALILRGRGVAPNLEELRTLQGHLLPIVRDLQKELNSLELAVRAMLRRSESFDLHGVRCEIEVVLLRLQKAIREYFEPELGTAWCLRMTNDMLHQLIDEPNLTSAERDVGQAVSILTLLLEELARHPWNVEEVIENLERLLTQITLRLREIKKTRIRALLGDEQQYLIERFGFRILDADLRGDLSTLNSRLRLWREEIAKEVLSYVQSKEQCPGEPYERGLVEVRALLVTSDFGTALSRVRELAEKYPTQPAVVILSAMLHIAAGECLAAIAVLSDGPLSGYEALRCLVLAHAFARLGEDEVVGNNVDQSAIAAEQALVHAGASDVALRQEAIRILMRMESDEDIRKRGLAWIETILSELRSSISGAHEEGYPEWYLESLRDTATRLSQLREPSTG